MKTLIIGSVALLWLPFFSNTQAAPQLFQQGVHYQLINPTQPTESKNKVEVIELLWYGCQTCFVIQNDLEKWVNQNKQAINYRRMPAITNENMMLLARAFYTAEVLDVHYKIHKSLFTAIHQHKRRLDTEESIAEFFTEHGVDKKDFRRAFRSSYVAGKIRRARIMSKRYGSRGAPTIIINGKYRVDISMVTSPREFIDVIDFLVKKESSKHL